MTSPASTPQPRAEVSTRSEASTTARGGTSRPILFSAPMVRALLEGRKTQTRRLMKPQPRVGVLGDGTVIGSVPGQLGDGDYHVWTPAVGSQRGSTIPLTTQCLYRLERACPYGQPGDHLWVRETWRAFGDSIAEKDSLSTCTGPKDLEYRADFTEAFDLSIRSPWRPSIHMPRWASRLTLEVTSIRVERVQGISASDVLAEGVQPNLIAGNDFDIDGNLWKSGEEKCRASFANLWNADNGFRAWERNDWVWVVGFKVVKGSTKSAEPSPAAAATSPRTGEGA